MLAPDKLYFPQNKLEASTNIWRQAISQNRFVNRAGTIYVFMKKAIYDNQTKSTVQLRILVKRNCNVKIIFH